jgi:hypothetical protein
MTNLKMKEIADRINSHLKRFEADPEINKTDPRYQTRPYYYAGAAYVGGARISVGYVSYQGRHSLTKAEALAYLEWLDDGNVGKHFKQQGLA